MPRREFPKQVKRARLAHANGHCEGCGQPLQPRRYEFDHDDPDWRGGEPTFENCRVLCKGPGTMRCHEIKTAGEAPLKAKSDRIRDDWNNTATTRRQRLQGKPFRKAPPQHTATTPPLKIIPRRPYP